MFAEIQVHDFSQETLFERLRKDADTNHKGNVGAIVTFTGLVRDNNQSGRIEGIELEHYPEMTQATLEKLVQEASHRFSLRSAGVVHRVGRLLNDEQIVWVGCAAAHRQAAFDGASFLMDMLKQSVPLWKKELKQGESIWVKPKASDDDAALKWLK